MIQVDCRTKSDFDFICPGCKTAYDYHPFKLAQCENCLIIACVLCIEEHEKAMPPHHEYDFRFSVVDWPCMVKV